MLRREKLDTACWSSRRACLQNRARDLDGRGLFPKGTCVDAARQVLSANSPLGCSAKSTRHGPRLRARAGARSRPPARGWLCRQHKCLPGLAHCRRAANRTARSPHAGRLVAHRKDLRHCSVERSKGQPATTRRAASGSVCHSGEAMGYAVKNASRPVLISVPSFVVIVLIEQSPVPSGGRRSIL